MAEALGWGAFAASSLIFGALLGLARPWPERVVGVVLAFGAGALISAVSFDLAEEGVQLGGGDSVALGLAVGRSPTTWPTAPSNASASLSAPGRPPLRRRPGTEGRRSPSARSWTASPNRWCSASASPLATASASGCWPPSSSPICPKPSAPPPKCRAAGRTRAAIVRLWTIVALICTFATVVGYGIADVASGDLQAAINGFAAGALLVMLIDSMIPEAARQAGKVAGLVTVLGFAVAAGLSGVS